jgi:NAD(P)-dependent dehydrogenase (short-subunit alcohol dehydrogenase family)
MKLIIGEIVGAGKGARVINVASMGFEHDVVEVRGLELPGMPRLNTRPRTSTDGKRNGKNYHSLGAYAQSKTVNVLFSAALAEKLENKGIQSYPVHAGGRASLQDEDLPLHNADSEPQ